MLLAQEESLPAVRGLQHDVAVAAKDATDDGAHLVVVLDEEDRLVAANGMGLRPLRSASVGGPAYLREVNLERRPLAGLALDPDVTPTPLHAPEQTFSSRSLPMRNNLRYASNIE
jgi:hypothetical protein